MSIMWARLFPPRRRTLLELRSALRRAVFPFEDDLGLAAIVDELDGLRHELTGTASREVLLEQALRDLVTVAQSTMDAPAGGGEDRDFSALRLFTAMARRLVAREVLVIREGETLADARPLDRRRRGSPSSPARRKR